MYSMFSGENKKKAHRFEKPLTKALSFQCVQRPLSLSMLRELVKQKKRRAKVQIPGAASPMCDMAV